MPLGTVALREYVPRAGESLPSAFYSGADPAYLNTLRIPLREGRWFNESDMANGRAVVVDERFAKRFFGGRSALGQRVAINGTPKKEDDWPEIVGVVGNVRHNGVEGESGHPFVYQPLPQVRFFGRMSVFLRTARPVSRRRSTAWFETSR